ncbi:hypothetical protein [Nitrincola tapanii]|nr:hypothetical protein [Nitrincola tapanii]
MRLTPKQQQIIVTTLRRYFGQSSRILLFGSRVDDNAQSTM